MRTSDLRRSTLCNLPRSERVGSDCGLKGLKPGIHFWVLLATVLASTLACSRAFATSEQVLWNFSFNDGDGSQPNGGLIADPNGNLLGTTFEGGNNGVGTEVGTIFKLTPDGQESVLWSFGENFFAPPDGQSPVAGLIMDKNGNLFGTTAGGGLYDQGPFSTDSGGTVFEFSAAGQESVLWNFGNGADGVAPDSSLAIDASGNLYGTTRGGAQMAPVPSVRALPSN